MSLTLSERVRYFDEYAQSVDMALRDPQVANRLGTLATRILDANASTFLPNERGGQMLVPREYHDSSDAIAIVPVSPEEAPRSTHLIQPIYDRLGEWRKMSDRVISSISGVALNTDVMLHWLENESDEAYSSYTSPKGLKVVSAANTSVAFVTSNDDEGGQYYAASYPVIVIKADLLEGLNHWNQAGTVAHEELHGVDIANNPIIYKMPIGGAGSELAAYRVSDASYSMTSEPAAPRAFTQEVEQWRQQHMSQEAPYVPNDEQLGILRGWVVE